MIRSLRTPIGLARRRDRTNQLGVKSATHTPGHVFGSHTGGLPDSPGEIKRPKLSSVKGGARLTLDSTLIPSALLNELRQAADINSVRGGVQPDGWAYITVDESLLVWDTFTTFSDVPRQFNSTQQDEGTSERKSSFVASSRSETSHSQNFRFAMSESLPSLSRSGDDHSSWITLIPSSIKRSKLAAVVAANPKNGLLDIWVIPQLGGADIKHVKAQIPLSSNGGTSGSRGETMDSIQSIVQISTHTEGTVLFITTRQTAAYLMYIRTGSVAVSSSIVELKPIEEKPNSSAGARILNSFKSAITSWSSVLSSFTSPVSESSANLSASPASSSKILQNGCYSCAPSSPLFDQAHFTPGEHTLINVCTIDDVVAEGESAIFLSPTWLLNDAPKTLKALAFITSVGIHVVPLTVSVPESTRRIGAVRVLADYVSHQTKHSRLGFNSSATEGSFPSLTTPGATNIMSQPGHVLHLSSNELGKIVGDALKGNSDEASAFVIHNASCSLRRTVLICSSITSSESIPLIVTLPSIVTLLEHFSNSLAPDAFEISSLLSSMDVSRLDTCPSSQDVSSSIVISIPNIPGIRAMGSSSNFVWANVKCALIDTPSPYVLATNDAAPLVPILFLSIGNSAVVIHPALVDPSSVPLSQIRVAATEPSPIVNIGSVKPLSMSIRLTSGNIASEIEGTNTAKFSTDAPIPYESNGLRIAACTATSIFLIPSGTVIAIRCEYRDEEVTMASALSQQFSTSLSFANEALERSSDRMMQGEDISHDENEHLELGIADLSSKGSKASTWALASDNPIEIPFRTFLRSNASNENLSSLLSLHRASEGEDFKFLNDLLLSDQDNLLPEVAADESIERLISAANVCSKEPTLFLPAWPPRPAAAISEGRVSQWALALRRVLPKDNSFISQVKESTQISIQGDGIEEEDFISNSNDGFDGRSYFTSIFGNLPSLSSTTHESEFYHPPSALDVLIVGLSKHLVDASPGHIAALESTFYQDAFDVRSLTSVNESQYDISAVSALRSLALDPLLRSLAVKRRAHYDLLRFLVTPSILQPQGYESSLKTASIHSHPLARSTIATLPDALRPVSLWSLMSSTARQAVLTHAQQICVAASLRSFFSAITSANVDSENTKGNAKSRTFSDYYRDMLREAIRTCVEASVEGDAMSQSIVNSMIQQQGLSLVDAFFSTVTTSPSQLLKVLAEGVNAAQRSIPNSLAELLATTYTHTDPEEDVDFELLGGVMSSNQGSTRAVRAALSSLAFNSGANQALVRSTLTAFDSSSNSFAKSSLQVMLRMQGVASESSNEFLRSLENMHGADELGAFSLKARLPPLPTICDSAATELAVEAVRAFTLASTLALTVTHVIQRSAITSLDDVIVRFGDWDGNFIPKALDRDNEMNESVIYSHVSTKSKLITQSAAVRIFRARIMRHSDETLRTRHAPHFSAVQEGSFAPPPTFGISADVLRSRFELLQSSAAASLWLASSLVLPFVQNSQVIPHCRSTLELPSDSVLRQLSKSSSKATHSSQKLIHVFSAAERRALCQTLFTCLFSQADALCFDLSAYIFRVSLLKRLYISRGIQSSDESGSASSQFAINSCENRAINAFQLARRVLLMTVTAPLIGMEEAFVRITKLGRALKLIDTREETRTKLSGIIKPVPTSKCSEDAAAALLLTFDGCTRFTIENAFQLAENAGDIEAPILLTELEVHRATRLVRELACVSARDLADTANQISVRRLNPLIAKHGVAAAVALFDLYTNRTTDVLTLLPPPGPITLQESISILDPSVVDEVSDPLVFSQARPSSQTTYAIGSYVLLAKQRLTGRLLLLGKQQNELIQDFEYSELEEQNLNKYANYLAIFLRTGSTSTVLREALKSQDFLKNAENFKSPIFQTSTESFATLSTAITSQFALVEADSDSDRSKLRVPESPTYSALRSLSYSMRSTNTLSHQNQSPSLENLSIGQSEEEFETPLMPVEAALHDILTTRDFKLATKTLVSTIDFVRDAALSQDSVAIEKRVVDSSHFVHKAAHVFALAKLCGTLSITKDAIAGNQEDEQVDLPFVNQQLELTEIQSALEGSEVDVAYLPFEGMDDGSPFSILCQINKSALQTLAQGVPLNASQLAVVLLGVARAELDKDGGDAFMIEDYIWRAVKVILLGIPCNQAERDEFSDEVRSMLFAHAMQIALAADAQAWTSVVSSQDGAKFAEHPDITLSSESSLQTSLWTRIAASLSITEVTVLLPENLRVTPNEIALAFMNQEESENIAVTPKRSDTTPTSLWLQCFDTIDAGLKHCLDLVTLTSVIDGEVQLAKELANGPARNLSNFPNFPVVAKPILLDIFTKGTRAL